MFTGIISRSRICLTLLSGMGTLSPCFTSYPISFINSSGFANALCGCWRWLHCSNLVLDLLCWFQLTAICCHEWGWLPCNSKGGGGQRLVEGCPGVWIPCLDQEISPFVPQVFDQDHSCIFWGLLNCALLLLPRVQIWILELKACCRCAQTCLMQEIMLSGQSKCWVGSLLMALWTFCSGSGKLRGRSVYSPSILFTWLFAIAKLCFCSHCCCPGCFWCWCCWDKPWI